MEAISFVNGEYVPHREARVSVEDRGFQFGDSVYEVVLVYGGRMIDAEGHLSRLQRSMDRMRFVPSNVVATLRDVMAELVARNALSEGMIYVQVTRGGWTRNLAPGSGHSKPTIVAYVRSLDLPKTIADARAFSVVLMPDRRWSDCDIKTTALTANLLARGEAIDRGYDDAWLVDRNGDITEASAANAWIVTGNVLITRPEGPEILGGITRQRILSLAASLDVATRIEPFSAEAAQRAEEAFITSATALVTPVVRIGDLLIGTGKPGVVTTRLFDAYRSYLMHAG